MFETGKEDDPADANWIRLGKGAFLDRFLERHTRTDGIDTKGNTSGPSFLNRAALLVKRNPP